MSRIKYKYHAGISDKNSDWLWQGNVVAHNQTKAKKLLQTFIKKNKLRGRVEIMESSHFREKTNKKIGIKGI